jgi:CRP-like cAMP-binding protein
MDNRLINYFLKITNLTADETKVLAESMVVKNFNKNEYLLKEGQFTNDTFFILNGCVRQFKTLDGNDITTNFYTEEQWIISLENFERKTASKYNLVCMEATTVVIGNEQKAQELFKQFPRFETTSRQIMETVFMEQQNLMTSYIADKPEQRYLKLLETRPDIFQRVPQYDIATYIGVKPESLSRIRKKLQMRD